MPEGSTRVYTRDELQSRKVQAVAMEEEEDPIVLIKKRNY